MFIVKSPFRVCLFGGSTDYESFYNQHESLLIGTTINKYVYICMEQRPRMFSNETVIMNSHLQHINNVNHIKNQLIKQTFKFFDVELPVSLTSCSDVPSRVGLGGSSSYCVGLSQLIRRMKGMEISKSILAKDAIEIERNILKDPGGIQDQIWAAYGGLNSIRIKKDGKFIVKKIDCSPEFKKDLEQSFLLVYTNGQRENDIIAKSHEHQNETKMNILSLAKIGEEAFKRENVKEIGQILYESWKHKRSISKWISNQKVDSIIKTSVQKGAYGAKLLGSGGCGFVLIMCNPKVKKVLQKTFEGFTFDIQFENKGASEIKI
jgi:D-glycero-alpha-D-manno-heptose-7-phosphate kinase